jgi:hypothetical protein
MDTGEGSRSTGTRADGVRTQAVPVNPPEIAYERTGMLRHGAPCGDFRFHPVEPAGTGSRAVI